MSQFPWWTGYAVGAFAVAVVALVRLALHDALGENALFLAFTVPVLAAAIAGGLRAGLLTTTLALAVGATAFVPPAEWGATDNLGQFALFVVAGALISLLAERGRVFGALTSEQSMALAEAEEYRAIVEGGAGYICRFRLDGTLTFVNAAYCECFGRSRAELLGSRFAPLVPDADRPLVEQLLAALAGGADVYTHEHRVILPDGRVRWHRWTNRTVPGGERLYQAIGIDITERREAEQALRERTATLEARVAERTAALEESERRFNAVFHSQFQFIGLMSVDGTLLEANRTALAAAGVSEADVLNRPYWETAWWAHDPAQQERLKAAVERAAGGEQDRFEAHHTGASGARVWVDFSLTPFRDETGRVALLVPEGRDVTDRKRAEERVRESDGVLRALTQVQREFLVNADPRASFERLLAVLINATGSAYGFIGEVLREADGTPYLKTHAITNIAWDDATRAFYEQGAPAGLEFRNLNTLFGAVLRTGGVVLANDPAHDPRSGGLPHGHPPLDSFLGLPFFQGDELIGTVGLANRPGGYDGSALDQLAPILATCSNLLFSYRLERQRARAATALRMSEERFRMATAAAGVGVWEWHIPSGRVVWNDQMFPMFGVPPTPDGAVNYETWSAAVVPEDLPAQEERLRATVARLGSDTRTFRIRLPGGAVRVIEAYETVRPGPGGAAEWMVGTNLDVTARKRAEEHLRESEARFRGAFDSTAFGMALVAPNGHWLRANPAVCALLGYTEGELLGTDFQAHAHPDDRVLPRARVAAALAGTGGPFQLEARYRHKSGAPVWALLSAALVRDEAGAPLYFVVQLKDITARKVTEAALRASEELYRSVVESLAEGIVVQDAAGAIVACNDRACAALGLTRDQMLGRSSLDPRWRTLYEDGSPMPGDEQPSMRVLRTGLPVFDAVVGVHKPTGELRWLKVNSVPVRRTGDAPGPATVASFHDVTAARALDEQVRASLREKELLLKEIHHRVKNNLQIVSTLLDLQSGFTTDPAALALFAESRGRVKSMALVHERLYKSHDVARVDFGEYARQLGADLARAYRAPDGAVRVDVEATAPPLALDVAIPCGLLLNELMSNCFKHAFADGRSGTVRVRFTADGDARELAVADDGPGLPPGFDVRSAQSFGLQLVCTLVEQLNGTIDARGPGAAFAVRFRAPGK
jgi:PAS domain S-box-containing protein